MKLLVTSTAPFEFDPPEGVDVVYVDPGELVPPEHLDADAAVVEGGAAPAVTQLAREASRLRWVQTLAAGPDGVFKAGFGPDVQITNGRGFHDQTVSEVALALALAGVNRLPRLLELQKQHVFAHDEFGAWRALHPDDRVATLIGANVLIWGFGSIGQTAAKLFAAASAHVRGVANSAGERAGFEVFTDESLPELLPETDVLVMVLPSTPETDKALNAERIAQLKPISWVVNVGRGTTIDEDALDAALRSGRLGGAALDVTATEPYPADGPLWDAPNCIITPHVAGGRAVGAGEFICRNIERLRRGEPLENLVSR